MSLIVKTIETQIKEIIEAAAKAAMAKGELPEAELTAYSIDKPSDSAHGDFALNCAMSWSRVFRNAPRKIAETLMANADFSGSYI